VGFRKNEGGFSLVELLVAIGILSVISVGFYTVLFSTSRGSDAARSVASVSSGARLTLSRIVRDTRQGQAVLAAGPTSFRVQVDFDGNQLITPQGQTNAQGDYEDLTYAFDNASGRLTLEGQMLAEGLACVKTAGVCSQAFLGSGPWPVSTYGSNPPNVFAYTSNRLEFDWNSDGVATWQELDAAPAHGVIGVGNNNGILDSAEFGYIAMIDFNLVVTDGRASSTFAAQAQLRNQR
jgi:prepilin-type N-terminal cleavage/methylation domain-containing protein